jgi:hypothetical protein
VNSCGCNQGDTSVLISGNGTQSDNNVRLNQNSSTDLFQNNNANVVNAIDSNAKTGGNDANRNTGGDVLVHTGDAQSIVTVGTQANANWARVGGNGGNGGSTDVVISGNGSFSDNRVRLNSDPSVTLVQDNNAYVVNTVDSNAKTGGNDANDNTGGDVTVRTGSALSDTLVDNQVNFNAADVDCGCVSDVFAKIAGNGTGSDNKIVADLGGDNSVFQGGGEGAGNDASLVNALNGDAFTGWNDANRNTGSVGNDPMLGTGDAQSVNTVHNSGNVNVYGSGIDLPSVGNLHFNFDMGNLFGGLWNWMV